MLAGKPYSAIPFIPKGSFALLLHVLQLGLVMEKHVFSVVWLLNIKCSYLMKNKSVLPMMVQRRI